MWAMPMPMPQFERLYAEHAEQLVKFLVYRTGNSAVAEDLAADTFERAIRARRGLDHRRGSEKAWLYTIALNLLRDQHRRRGVEQRATERSVAGAVGGDGPSMAEKLGARDEIARALETLSAEERDVISLRFGADLSIKEIAGITREKAATVEKRIYRALGRLREQLSSEEPAG